MKLHEWNARLHGLVIFRSLLSDPVAARFAALIDCLTAGNNSVGTVCDAVAQFESVLFERTTNWGTYLSTTVLETETVCVRQAAAGTLPPVLQTALDNELAFLQQLCGPDTGCPAGRGRGPGRRAGLPAPVGDGRP